MVCISAIIFGRFYGTSITRQRYDNARDQSGNTAIEPFALAPGEKYSINSKTVVKWRSRDSVKDAVMGPKKIRSSVLSLEEEAAVVAFRKHTLLPLDDCLYALQASIPHLTRSSLHRCLQHHGISRLPDVRGSKPKKKFKQYPIGYFHIDIAEVRTEEGKLHMFVAIDRTGERPPIYFELSRNLLIALNKISEQRDLLNQTPNGPLRLQPLPFRFSIPKASYAEHCASPGLLFDLIPRLEKRP